MEDHISNLKKERLKSVVDKYHRKLVFIKMPSQEEVYPGVTVNLGRTYARMALGEILPKSVDRVLSLDSDTLVMDSLHEIRPRPNRSWIVLCFRLLVSLRSSTAR